MAQVNTKDFSTLPVGRLGLIPLQSCSSLGAKVNDWLVKWRAERQYPGMDSFAFEGYKRDSYIIDAKTPRFGSGEGKCTINESVRGDDIYVMVDVTNYSLSYPIGPYTNLMSPDDHFHESDAQEFLGYLFRENLFPYCQQLSDDIADRERHPYTENIFRRKLKWHR